MANEDYIKLKEKYGSEDAMKVPEGYFGTFTTRLQDRISAELRAEPPTLNVQPGWLRHRLVPVMALSGVVMVALIFSLHWFAGSTKLIIPQAQMSDLIEYTGYNFDEDQIIEVMGDKTELHQSSARKAQILEYLSTQELDLTDVTIDF